jgi:hypothetical protein
MYFRMSFPPELYPVYAEMETTHLLAILYIILENAVIKEDQCALTSYRECAESG